MIYIIVSIIKDMITCIAYIENTIILEKIGSLSIACAELIRYAPIQKTESETPLIIIPMTGHTIAIARLV
jgi:hypothetical protein